MVVASSHGHGVVLTGAWRSAALLDRDGQVTLPIAEGTQCWWPECLMACMRLAPSPRVFMPHCLKGVNARVHPSAAAPPPWQASDAPQRMGPAFPMHAMPPLGARCCPTGAACCVTGPPACICHQLRARPREQALSEAGGGRSSLQLYLTMKLQPPR